jgi:hypothetical protein
VSVESTCANSTAPGCQVSAGLRPEDSASRDNLPKQSRGVAATAKCDGSEMGYTSERGTSRDMRTGRFPGGTVYSRSRVRETCQVWIRKARNQSGFNLGLLPKRALSPKTGYVSIVIITAKCHAPYYFRCGQGPRNLIGRNRCPPSAAGSIFKTT